jgi:hypothetical protein
VITVYISIGNSDDKLSQAEWAEYYRAVNELLRHFVAHVHGQWVAESTSVRQNACWCVEFDAGSNWITADGRTVPLIDLLQERLARLVSEFRQDSIIWATADTVFIKPFQAHSTYSD